MIFTLSTVDSFFTLWPFTGHCESVIFTLSLSSGPQVKVSVKRLRKYFGAPCSFTNRNSGETKQSVIECLPYEDRGFDLKRVELDHGTQVMLALCHYGLGFGSRNFQKS